MRHDLVRVEFIDKSATSFWVSEDENIQDVIVGVCENKGWDTDTVTKYIIEETVEEMTFRQALEIMVNGTEDSDLRYEAIQVIEMEVAAVSEYGDPDRSLGDWIAAGQYKLTDTAESIAVEWDDRED